MRTVYLLIFLGVMSACSSTGQISKPEDIPRFAAFEASGFTLTSKKDVLSISTITQLSTEKWVQNTGDKLLAQIIIAYSDQLNELEYAHPAEADVIFKIKSVEVKRSYLTLNFPHPGPIYKVTMRAEIEEKGGRVQTVKLVKKANMSEINFPEVRYKRMSAEEKNNFKNQYKTLNAAIRQLYQQLYFQYFDISLQL